MTRTKKRTPCKAACSLLAAAAVLFWAHPALGEDPPPERFEEEVVVSEVLLDAVITDKSGRVILGLGKDDFVVRENGEEVEIAGVSFYSSQERKTSDAIELPGFDLSDIPEDRYFIIFVQEVVGGSIGDLRVRMQRAGRALEEWVSAKLDPADVLAVVSYGNKLKVHQDFTRDRELLSTAIGQAVRGVDPERQWPSRQPPKASIGPLLSALPSGKELRRQTRDIYKGLQVLSRAAAEIQGRKNLIFVGTGFDPLHSPDYHRMWPTMQALNDANIAAYTIDVVPTEVRHSSRPSLQSLALATGGDFFFNFIRFEAPLERIATGTSGYYLIAYKSEHPSGEAGYQRVKVKLANPEFRVRARAGYAFGERDAG